MKKFHLMSFLFLLCTVCAVSAAYADPPGRAGRVSFVAGSALFYDEAGGWREAQINYPVTSQNSFATREGGRAEVRAGSVALRIDGNSQLDLLALTDNLIDARLTQGALNLRVRNLYNGDSIRIATPQTVATIRGPGLYRIDADNQATRVTVLQGAAGVAVAGNQESVLYAGTSTVVGVYGNVNGQLDTALSDAFDDWSRERDHRFERTRSAQYVSPEMTGYEALDEHGSWRNEPAYGAVWVPSYVTSGWAPYQDGRWVFVQPWGWTWVDNAPWGFAPSHYGRWVNVNGYWAWAPGSYHARPVYAPALVAFVGDPDWNASFSFGNSYAVGWFPLGYNEPYRPYYNCSPTYVQNVNLGHHGNPRVRRPNDDRYLTSYANRQFTTVVPRDHFVGGQPINNAQRPTKISNDAPIARSLPVGPGTRSYTKSPEPIEPPQPVVNRRNPADDSRVVNLPAQVPPTKVYNRNPLAPQPAPVVQINNQPPAALPQQPRAQPVVQAPVVNQPAPREPAMRTPVGREPVMREPGHQGRDHEPQMVRPVYQQAVQAPQPARPMPVTQPVAVPAAQPMPQQQAAPVQAAPAQVTKPDQSHGRHYEKEYSDRRGGNER
jgi:FecR protein